MLISESHRLEPYKLGSVRLLDLIYELMKMDGYYLMTHCYILGQSVLNG